MCSTSKNTAGRVCLPTTSRTCTGGEFARRFPFYSTAHFCLLVRYEAERVVPKHP